MNTRRTSATRVGDDIVNAGANPKGKKILSQVQAAANDQLLINRTTVTHGEVREALF